MKKLQTKWRRHPVNPPLLTTDSVTQPAMALSVMEILERFRTGRPLPDLTNKSFYDGDLMLPEPGMLDINDREEYADAVADRIDDLTQLLNEQQEEQRKQADITDPADPADSTKPS